MPAFLGFAVLCLIYVVIVMARLLANSIREINMWERRNNR